MPLPHRRTYRHSEAVKHLAIERDTTAARHIWQELVEEDTTYGPALYYLSLTSNDKGGEAIELARRAYRADTMNKWYATNYASRLLTSGHYAEALPMYRRLLRLDNREITTYHALALLYGVHDMPYSAIAILDSAELRLGSNPYLASLKQSLLFDTRQYDRVIREGETLIAEAPYNAEAHITLAKAYEAQGRDSMASALLERAFRIDTTDLGVIVEVADFYNRKGNTRRMLDMEERLFVDDRLSVEEKMRRLEQYTTHTEFYREYFFRLGAIIVRLAVDYPDNRRVINAYASHLIAAGNDDEALSYLRRHLDDTSARPADFISVIELEKFMKRDDAVEEDLYKAINRFPNDVELLLYTSYLEMASDRDKDALKRLKRGLKVADNPLKRSNIYGLIGDIYHEQGNDRAAFKAYERALEQNPNNSSVLNNYAYFSAIAGGDLDRAEEMARRATAITKGNSTFIDTLAWVLHLKGEDKEAKTLMRQALSLDGQKDVDLLTHYGDILWSLGEKFMAETYWQKAVEMGYDPQLMQQHINELKNK